VVLAHGIALRRLLDASREPWFACIDSDIFVPVDGAPGPLFAPDLAPLLETTDAIFSCLPVWQLPGETLLPTHYRWAVGRNGKTTNGYVTGVTYCMLYRRERLLDTLSRWNLALTPYQWRDVPSRLQREFRRRQLAKRFYDAAKVLNLALAVDGARTVLIESPGLVHIGAGSGNRPDGRLGKAPVVRSPGKRLLASLKAAVRRLLGQRLTIVIKGVDRREAQEHVRLFARRRAAQAVLDGLPLEPTLDPAFVPQFEQLRAQIAAVRAACAQALASAPESAHPGIGAPPAPQVAPTNGVHGGTPAHRADLQPSPPATQTAHNVDASTAQ
jgi:hypothetical protein